MTEEKKKIRAVHENDLLNKKIKELEKLKFELLPKKQKREIQLKQIEGEIQSLSNMIESSEEK